MTRHLLTFLVVLLCAAGGPQGSAEKQPPREKAVIAGETFELEIAADEKGRARGLMHRTSIDEHGGMVFAYPGPRWMSFWMKDCLLDIDLVYLERFGFDDLGRIVRLHKMKVERPRGDTEPERTYERRLKSYSSRRPAQFAVELKAGTIDRLKLEVGQTIAIDVTHLEALARKALIDERNPGASPP